MSSASSSSSVWVEMATHFASCCELDFTIQFEGKMDSLKAHKNFLQMRWKDYPKLLQLVKEKAVNNVVTLWDDPVVFKRLFQYFHTEEFPDRPSYTDDDVVNILKLGYRYCPQEMIEVTRKLFLDRGLRLKNAYKMLNKSNQFGLSTLKEMASDYIDGVNRNAEMYLASADFLELGQNCLENLLQSDDLACEEIKVFEAVIRWGKNQPNSDTASQLRNILEFAIFLIRFPLMTSLQLSTTVRKSGLLKVEEMIDVLSFAGGDEDTRQELIDTHTFRFNSNPRVLVPVHQQEDDDKEGDRENLDQAQNDMDFEYGIAKTESPIPSTSRGLPPLTNLFEESDDGSISSRNSLFTPKRNPRPWDLVAKTWQEMMVKVGSGEIPRNTTELRCTVKTDFRIRGKNFPPILLPHLEKLVLDLHIPDKPETTAIKAVLLLRKEFNVAQHMFLNQDQGDEVSIEVILNGCTLFKWAPAEREVLIGFGGQHSEPFLERLKDRKVMKRFSTLTIVDNKLTNVRGTFPGSSVKDVMLWGIEDESSLLLGNLLRNFVNLECLSCWTEGPLKEEDEREENSPPREIPMIDIHRDLTSGDKLVKLSICQAALVVHPEDSITDIVKANLTEFYTDSSHFSQQIYSNFHTIFPKLRKVSFGYNGFTVTKKFRFTVAKKYLLGQEIGNRFKRRKIFANHKEKTIKLMTSQTVQLVNNILKIKDIEMIRIAYLEWDLVPKNIVAERNVKAFLKRAGWPARKQDKDVLLTDFLVTKDAKTGKWKLDKRINPDGRCADEQSEEYDGYWEYMDELEFQYFGLKRIFKDFDKFKRFNVEFDD